MRLGKIPEDRLANPRPLLVSFKSPNNKQLFMENLSKLKSSEEKFRKLSIAHDMTKTEREKAKVLIIEAKESSDSSENWVFRIVGPPWDMKVIKRKKNM